MRKKLMGPATLIAIALLGMSGLLWMIGSPSRFFTSTESFRYAAKPAGWDSAAGQCAVCHSLERNEPWRVAPSLWDVVGAPKAGAKGYGYSLALAEAGGVWTEQELDEYLADPGGFLPGTTKILTGLPDPQERARIIEFLGTLKK
jgi:cytochrome c2